MKKIGIPLLFLGTLLLLAGCPKTTPPAAPPAAASPATPVSIIAYINVSSGCQQDTVDFLNGLKQKYPRLQVEMVDFGDGGDGAKRWQASGYKCMTIEINGLPYAKFPEKGTEKTVAFKMPTGFLWTHEDLEAAVEAALDGQLQPATEQEAMAAQPPATIKAEVKAEQITKGGKEVAQVALNKQQLFVITASAGGQSPKARAEAAVAALKAWLAQPVKPSDLTLKQAGQGWAVMAGDKEVLLATEADAKAAKTTAQNVGKKWLMGIKHGVVVAASGAESPLQDGQAKPGATGTGETQGGASK